MAFVPQRLDHADHRRDADVAFGGGVGEAQVFGPHPDHHLLDPGRFEVLDQLGGHRHSPARELRHEAAVDAVDVAGHGVHGRAADEARHEEVGRFGVDVLGCADLLQHAVVEHRDPVAHRHRLDLVVGDVDDRRRQAALQLHQLRTRLHPQLGVEVGERLVHEERLRAAHDRARQRDPLTLPARQLRGLAVEQAAEVEAVGGLLHQCRPLGRRHLARPQRELDVPPHGHVRVERVALEHHRDVAVLGLDVVDDALADGDGARRGVLEPRDHPQRGRLAAARRAEEHEELLVGDVEGEHVDGGDVVEPLRHLIERDPPHVRFPPVRCASSRAGPSWAGARTPRGTRPCHRCRRSR